MGITASVVLETVPVPCRCPVKRLRITVPSCRSGWDIQWSPSGEVGLRSTRWRSCGAGYQTWGIQGTKQQTTNPRAGRAEGFTGPDGLSDSPRGSGLVPHPRGASSQTSDEGRQMSDPGCQGGKGVDGEGGPISWYGWRASPIQDLASVESTFTARRVPLKALARAGTVASTGIGPKDGGNATTVGRQED